MRRSHGLGIHQDRYRSLFVGQSMPLLGNIVKRLEMRHERLVAAQATFLGETTECETDVPRSLEAQYHLLHRLSAREPGEGDGEILCLVGHGDRKPRALGEGLAKRSRRAGWLESENTVPRVLLHDGLKLALKGDDAGREDGTGRRRPDHMSPVGLPDVAHFLEIRDP